MCCKVLQLIKSAGRPLTIAFGEAPEYEEDDEEDEEEDEEEEDDEELEEAGEEEEEAPWASTP